MNQTTSSGMTLLDYAKSAVERFVKRVRYQHHFLLISCGVDNATANANAKLAAAGAGDALPPWNGRVRIGWDQATNKEAFLAELKNLRATDMSDLGSSIKQAFELMNQIRLALNWDNYGLGRMPGNTNVGVCVVLTDATTFSGADGMMQDALTIPPSTAVGADLTLEPYRWDQRIYTIALKLSATTGVRAQPSVPTDLMALSEATGGMLFMPTSKPAVEQSIDQIISKLKAGAVVKFRCEANDGEGDLPVSRNVIVPFPNTKEFLWPIAESFWLDRNTVSLPPREAHPTLVFKRTVEGAMEAATNHMLLDTLKFPADSYGLENALSPAPPRGQRWLVYVPNSRGDGRLGEPIGFLRAGSSSTASPMLVLLPYNFPALFSLLVEAARVYQASGQSINSPTMSWMFQAKAMPSSWRESFTAYLSTAPLYYYAPLKKTLKRYNLHDLVPEVHDSGRSYQISNYLTRLRDQANTENESINKANAKYSRVDLMTQAKPIGAVDSLLQPNASGSQASHVSDALGNMSLDAMMQMYNKSSKTMFSKPLRLPTPAAPRRLTLQPLLSVAPDTTLKLRPSLRANEEDAKHQQPIDSMSDYESRLIKKEALRNPLGDPDPDEDTPAGLRRRQLCFNLGNPYKKTSKQQQVSNVYQGEAADEAAALGGQSPKRQRTRKRSSQLKRDKKPAKRNHRAPSSPSFSSSPGSPSHSPSSPSSGSSTASSPVHSETGDSVMSDASVGSNFSVKAETAQLLGVPLRDGDALGDENDKSFARVVYGVLVENWEAWSNILRLIKARSISKQEGEFILSALSSMKGGGVVTRTYIQQAIRHAALFKKHDLITHLEQLQSKLDAEVMESKNSDDVLMQQA